MDTVFSSGGKFMRKMLIFILVFFLPVAAVYPVYGFSSGDTTPVGGTIVTALEPDGNVPDSYGEMVLRWTNRAGGDPGRATASPLETTVDTLAHPHLVATDKELALRPEIDVDSLPITAWNLGNASDTFDLDFESANNQEDSYSLCVDGSCNDRLDSTRRLRSVVSGTEDASQVFYFTVTDPIEESELPDTVTVTATTALDTGSWENSSRGRRLHEIVINIREVQLKELAFDKKVYAGREDLGLIFAEQLDYDSDRLTVEVWSEDLTGNRVSTPLEFELYRKDGTQLFERKFGFTETSSRLGDHPDVGNKTPVFKVEADTTVLKARIVEGDVSGDTSALWRPLFDAPHVESLDEVRTWPSPFNPTAGKPFVFQDLPADRGMEIFLYNVQGQLVRRLTVNRGIEYHASGNSARWWGKNDVGSRVSSGTYIYVVKSRYGVKRGKITLVK